MSASNWTCWTWEDGNGTVKYVGYGPFVKRHPAAERWANRFTDDSELHQWLQTMNDEPVREVCGAAVMIRKLAYTLATVYRSRHRDTILESRGSMSHNGGGVPRCVIYCPEDDILSAELFESVREASRKTKINPSNITRKCQNPKNYEWHYAEPEQVA